MPATLHAFSFTEGGSCHYKLEGHGQVMWGLFRFKKIEPNGVIEFVSSFSNEAGEVVKSPFPIDFPLEIYNSIELAEDDNGTTLTLTAYPINATDEQNAVFDSIKDSMTNGNNGTFNQLESYLKESVNG
ncbi:MAG: SRPBCC domain-containing protein [Chitinophagia bacterium]|nr:SRPBCC domain-containing protein [Chitinophagia bacterium]